MNNSNKIKQILAIIAIIIISLMFLAMVINRNIFFPEKLLPLFIGLIAGITVFAALIYFALMFSKILGKNSEDDPSNNIK